MRSWKTRGKAVKIEDRYQLASRFRRRYLAASKAQRGQLLSVFCEVTAMTSVPMPTSSSRPWSWSAAKTSRQLP